MQKKFNIDTNLIHKINDNKKEVSPVTESITPAVAYAFPNCEVARDVVSGKQEGIYYGRYGNPTLATLEEKISYLESGEAALGVSSGMAAISIAFMTFLQSKDHVIVTKDIYGGTHKFLTNIASRYDIEYTFVDCNSMNEINKNIKENTKVIYIETPSNPLLTILDIKKISEISRNSKTTLIIDNTFMSPYLQNPLELGADVVVHSATKYLNGHGDVLAGFIVSNANNINYMRNNLMGDLGQVLSAWDSYLILRGLKTLGVRMSRHCKNASKVAKFLEAHPRIKKVYYPGLNSHPQYNLAQVQMKDMGGIVSFELKGGKKTSTKFINSLELIIISFSLGDPETLIQHPATMTHSSIPFEKRKAFGISDNLIRLSLSLENSEDIINDLNRALSVI